MIMILCVIDQPDRLDEVLKAWEAAGISGVTLLESSGLHRYNQTPHIPMRYFFGESDVERRNVTLFTVVEQEELVRRCLAITEGIIGDFDQPETGIFLSWPLGITKGVPTKPPFSPPASGEAS